MRRKTKRLYMVLIDKEVKYRGPNRDLAKRYFHRLRGRYGGKVKFI